MTVMVVSKMMGDERAVEPESIKRMHPAVHMAAP